MSTDELSALESSFLWFEAPGRPVHVAAVGIFDGAPLLDDQGRLRLAELRQLVDDRLDEVPRLRQRIVPGASPLDRPRWVDDPDFDVAHHVHEVALPPPGDEATFRRVAEEANARLFDLDHPPWELHLVTGLAGGRVGLLERVHHALVDGVGGVDLAAVFLDVEPGGRPGGGRGRRPDGETPTRAAGSPPPGAPAPPQAPTSPDAPSPSGAPTSPGAGTSPGPGNGAGHAGESAGRSMAEALGPWLRGPVGLLEAALSAVRHPQAAGRAAADVVRGVATVVSDGVTTPNASLTGGADSSRLSSPASRRAGEQVKRPGVSGAAPTGAAP